MEEIEGKTLNLASLLHNSENIRLSHYRLQANIWRQ